MNKFNSLEDMNFLALSEQELLEIDGGIAITILGVTYVGAKAIAILAGGGAVLAGAAGWGIWVGYNESRGK